MVFMVLFVLPTPVMLPDREMSEAPLLPRVLSAVVQWG